MNDIAVNLRVLRGRMGLTQAQLAERAGLSRRMISAIEAGGANISVQSIDRLARALSVSFATIVGSRLDEDRSRIAAVVWRGAQPGSEGILLGAAPVFAETEMWHWSLAPSEQYQAEADSDNSHEMIFVLTGTLTLDLGGHIDSVPCGDFRIFRAPPRYSFINGGVEVVQYIRNVTH